MIDRAVMAGHSRLKDGVASRLTQDARPSHVSRQQNLRIRKDEDAAAAGVSGHVAAFDG